MQSSKLALLVQVYKGGEYFKECLESIEPHLGCFSAVYISVNGSVLFDDDIKLAESFKTGHADNRIILFSWESTLSAAVHSKSFYEKVLDEDKESDFFMTLCHDDILLSDFTENSEHLRFSLEKDDMVSMAKSFFSFTFDSNSLIGTSYGNLLSYPKQRVEKTEYLMKCFDRYPETNCSGMVFPRDAFKEFTLLIPLFTYGYRSEYVQFANRQTTYVRGSAKPLVGIRMHPESEGACIVPEIIDKDVFFYICYLIFGANDRKLRVKYRKWLNLSVPSHSIFVFKRKTIFSLLFITGNICSFMYVYSRLLKVVVHTCIKNALRTIGL